MADSSSQGGKKRMIMKRRLEGKTALVTGASRGIGAGIVRVMAGEGATVLAADLTKDGAVGDVQSVVLDVTSAEQWEVCAERIRDQFGRLDILVNNAGIVANTSVEDTTLEDWRRVMRVNLDAVFMGCKAMLPLLRVAGQANPSGASVINVSSTMGISALPNQSAYGTSKAGVRHLSKLLAVEWAEAGYNIRVNSIHPGTTRTPMLEQAAEIWARDFTAEGTVEAGLKALAGMAPLNRIGSPEGIGYAATFLASDESAYVTGIELPVDGGYLAR